MDWAARKKLMVWVTIIGVALAFIAALSFAIFYDTPTCIDAKQNGDETGIDCGGSCSTVCSAEAQQASVQFARTLMQSGRSDLIAYLDNPNTDAYAKDAQVTINVYRQDGHILERHALVSLPARGSTPLYIPAIAGEAVQQVFVSFSEGSPVWTKGQGWEGEKPRVASYTIDGTDSKPRIIAVVSNDTAYPRTTTPFVATIFAEDGTVLAASQTIVPIIPAQGNSQAVFTWNEAFARPYARIEITPLLALPRFVP